MMTEIVSSSATLTSGVLNCRDEIEGERERESSFCH